MVSNLGFLLHHEELLVDVVEADLFGLDVPPAQDAFDGLEVVEINGLEDQRVEKGGVDQVKVLPIRQKRHFYFYYIIFFILINYFIVISTSLYWIGDSYGLGSAFGYRGLGNIISESD